MLVFRLVGVLLGLGIVGCACAYLFTRDRRYLGVAKRLLQFGVIAAFVFFGLLILERVLVPFV